MNWTITVLCILKLIIILTYCKAIIVQSMAQRIIICLLENVYNFNKKIVKVVNQVRDIKICMCIKHIFFPVELIKLKEYCRTGCNKNDMTICVTNRLHFEYGRTKDMNNTTTSLSIGSKL